MRFVDMSSEYADTLDLPDSLSINNTDTGGLWRKYKDNIAQYNDICKCYVYRGNNYFTRKLYFDASSIPVYWEPV